MKGKTTVGIMLILVLAYALLNAFPNVSASPAIKIGIIGPEGWTVGDGMLNGAELAAQQINDAGGVLGHDIEIVWADTLRGQADPDPATGTLAMEELVAQGVDFAIGCFRSESAFGAREVACDNQMIFFIAGSATDQLIDHPDTVLYPDTVRGNYARYKYLFRNTPMNSSMLVRSLVGVYALGIKGFVAKLAEDKLVKIYGSHVGPTNHPIYGPSPYPGGWPQVKYAVIAEEPVWATGIYYYLTDTGVAIPGHHYSILLGPWVNMTYRARVSAVATDVSTQLTEAVASGARLIIHILSGPVGTVFTNQWITEIPEADRPILVGINVPGQDQPDQWTATGGNAEYEAFLATAGTRTPINTEGPNLTTDYWDAYLTAYGDAPVYTSYGTYDSVMGIAEAITTFGHWPPTSQADYDDLIPIFEATDRHGVVGWFKYTTHHDLWNVDIGTTWPTGYSRAMICQWQGPEAVQPDFPPGTPACGRLEIVTPVDQSYSKRFRLPPWYYRLDGVDVNVTGVVDVYDALLVKAAFGSLPGAPNWNIETDIVVDGEIDIFDALSVRGLFGETEPIPYPD